MLRMLALVLLLLPLPLRAELYSSKINFQHVLENKDVVMGVVLSLHQDSDGYMWFGGENGLVRFDGYTLKPIELLDTSTNPPQTKAISAVTEIFEDSHGNIWVGSGNGMQRYDRYLEQLVRLPDHPSLAGSPLSALGVIKIDELANGKIVASTYSGLYVVDPQTGEGKVYRSSNGLSPGRINTVLHEADNVLWVGTGSGLDRLDTKTEQVTNFKPYSPDPDSVSDNGVNSLVSDGQGQFWLGTDKGLMHYNPKSKAYKRYVNDPLDPASFSGGDIWDLFVDSAGNLWVATDGGGLNQLDPETGVFSHFRHEAGRAGSLNSNVVRTVIEDKNGDIWVGNYPGGINFFDRSSAAIISYFNDPSDPNSLSYNSIMSLEKGADGDIWVGTDSGGLNYFDRSAQKFTRYLHDANDPNSISANAVLSMLLDSRNILWGGTWAGGIFQVDLNNKNRITRLPNDPKRSETAAITHSDRLNNDKVWCIYEDSKGAIWICTHEGGLSRYNRDTGEYTHYIETEDPKSISGNQVWTVLEDSAGNFWVGTTTGAGILNRETGEFFNFLYEEGKEGGISNPSVLSFFEDSKKRIWLGTNGGLNLYHKDTNSFTSYGLKEGFFNDSIRSILEDQQGRLWLGTNSGVTTLEPDTGKVKNYNRESGNLVGGFNYNSAVMTDKSEAVFGGKNGLRIYQTQKMQDNKLAPPIVMTDFKVLADSVIIGGDDGILQRSVNYTESLRLDYTQSVIEFEFAALNYRDSGKNRYAYLLEGFDENWVNAGDQRRAKYTNLDAGQYTFRVKGSNNDGVWNDIGKSIQIVQLPPPWQTWWAYTLYSLAFLGVVFWFVQAQRKKRKVIEEQNRILEIKVAERTAEISKKNKDIENMLANMHQGLLTIEGNGNIHPEYSQYLSSIFETTDISGRKVIDLLFSNSDLGSDIVNQVQEAIGAIVGEDEMNFDFNSHLLIQEYDINLDGKAKNLSVDWNPILVDDAVDKLMVTVRDVTELKKIEAESKAQQRELDIISQLLNISAKKYISFEKTSAEFVAENRQKIKSCADKNDEAIALLFRNMHTIKGNCRTFGFTHIGNIVHEVESVYSDLKKSSSGEWHQQALLDDLDRVELAIREYGKVYRDVLGRDEKSADRGNGMWLDANTIRSMQESIHSVQGQVPALKEHPAFKPIRQLFAKALTAPLEKVLAEVVQSLPSIANQLDKEDPIVKFGADKVRIKESAHELLTGIFAHVLRNSVDHGIESPEERCKAGKSPQGTIYIYTSLRPNKLSIHIADDGRGLNMEQLFEKGVASGLWSDSESPAPEKIAALIFESGVSTKEEVSDISGRGVGMDAVKQFICNKGGDIRLHLLDEQCKDSVFVRFEIILELPAEHCIMVDDEPLASVQNF